MQSRQGNKNAWQQKLANANKNIKKPASKKPASNNTPPPSGRNATRPTQTHTNSGKTRRNLHTENCTIQT